MVLRYARHTKSLDRLVEFYTKIIGLELLHEFSCHDGYDGVFLGKHGHSWHLEFTQNGTVPNQLFDCDDSLVFYPETKQAFDDILKNIELSGNRRLPL